MRETTKDGRILRWVVLRGRFVAKEKVTLAYSYIFDRKPISRIVTPDSSGGITLLVPIKGDRTYLTLSATGPGDKTTSEEIVLNCPSCVMPLVRDLKFRRWRFNPSLGVTHLYYTQSLASPYSAALLTAKLANTYWLSKAWSLGASAFMNLATLGANIPNTSLRFLGVNARAGFTFPSDDAVWDTSWQTTIMLGVYSLGMTDNSNTHGFDRVVGPSVTIAERKTFDSRNALSGYVKYAPMFLGNGLSFTSREIATGLTYERQIGSSFYTFAFDASLFDINVASALIHARTLNFNLGMQF